MEIVPIPSFQLQARKLDTARWYQVCLLVAFMCMRCEGRQFVSMWHGARCSHFGATALCWDCSTCLSASRCSSTSHKALRYGLECPHRLREVLLLTPCCKLASRSNSVVLRLPQSLRVSVKAHFILAAWPSWSVNFLGARGRGSILTSPSSNRRWCQGETSAISAPHRQQEVLRFRRVAITVLLGDGPISHDFVKNIRVESMYTGRWPHSLGFSAGFTSTASKTWSRTCGDCRFLYCAPVKCLARFVVSVREFCPKVLNSRPTRCSPMWENTFCCHVLSRERGLWSRLWSGRQSTRTSQEICKRLQVLCTRVKLNHGLVHMFSKPFPFSFFFDASQWDTSRERTRGPQGSSGVSGSAPLAKRVKTHICVWSVCGHYSTFTFTFTVTGTVTVTVTVTVTCACACTCAVAVTFYICILHLHFTFTFTFTCTTRRAAKRSTVSCVSLHKRVLRSRAKTFVRQPPDHPPEETLCVGRECGRAPHSERPRPHDGPERQLCLHRDVLSRGRFSRSSGILGSVVESTGSVVGRVFSQHTADVHREGSVRRSLLSYRRPRWWRFWTLLHCKRKPLPVVKKFLRDSRGKCSRFLLLLDALNGKEPSPTQFGPPSSHPVTSSRFGASALKEDCPNLPHSCPREDRTSDHHNDTGRRLQERWQNVYIRFRHQRRDWCTSCWCTSCTNSLSPIGRVIDFSVVQQTLVPKVQTGRLMMHLLYCRGKLPQTEGSENFLISANAAHLFKWSISPAWCGHQFLIHTVQKTAVAYMCNTLTRLSRCWLCCPQDALLLSSCRQPAFQTVKFIVDVAASRMPAAVAAASYSPFAPSPLEDGRLLWTGLCFLLASIGGTQWYGIVLRFSVPACGNPSVSCAPLERLGPCEDALATACLSESADCVTATVELGLCSDVVMTSPLILCLVLHLRWGSAHWKRGWPGLRKSPENKLVSVHLPSCSYDWQEARALMCRDGDVGRVALSLPVARVLKGFYLTNHCKGVSE